MFLFVYYFSKVLIFQSIKGEYGDVESCRVITLVSETMRVCEGCAFQMETTDRSPVHLFNEDRNRIVYSGNQLRVWSTLPQLLRIRC